MTTQLYTGPITISSTTTLKFLAVSPAGVIGDVQSAAYDIIINAAFALPGVTSQETTTAPAMRGVTSARFTAPNIAAGSSVSAPSLAGRRSSTFALPNGITGLNVAPPVLGGGLFGLFTAPLASTGLTVTAPQTLGRQVGTLSLPITTVYSTVQAPTVSVTAANVFDGRYELPALEMNTTTNPPTLTGVQTGSGSIRSADNYAVRVIDWQGNDLSILYA